MVLCLAFSHPKPHAWGDRFLATTVLGLTIRSTAISKPSETILHLAQMVTETLLQTNATYLENLEWYLTSESGKFDLIIFLFAYSLHEIRFVMITDPKLAIFYNEARKSFFDPVWWSLTSQPTA